MKYSLSESLPLFKAQGGIDMKKNVVSLLVCLLICAVFVPSLVSAEANVGGGDVNIQGSYCETVHIDTHYECRADGFYKVRVYRETCIDPNTGRTTTRYFRTSEYIGSQCPLPY